MGHGPVSTPQALAECPQRHAGPSPPGHGVNAGIAPYQAVLARPGAWAFSTGGLVARLPMSMISLGLILLVSTQSSSYTDAGFVSAAYLLGNALFAVGQARAIDRLGQSRVLPVTAVVSSTALLALMGCVLIGIPVPWLCLCAATAGAALPQIGSSVRARWSFLLDDDKDALHTAFAYEAVVDEVIFMVGPALVVTLATMIDPLAGVTCAVLATAVGTAVLVSQRRTEPPSREPARRADRLDPMPWAVLAPMIACAVAMGVLLGGAEVGTVAVCEELGNTRLSGVMLAVWAGGSLMGGVITGALEHKVGTRERARRGMVLLALLTLPLAFVHGFTALGIVLFGAGVAISPTLIASFAAIEETVPAGRLTEGITLFTTGLGAGLAPGAALVGLMVDRHGASTAYWIPAAAGATGATVALLFGGQASRRPTSDGTHSPEPPPAPAGASVVGPPAASPARPRTAVSRLHPTPSSRKGRATAADVDACRPPPETTQNHDPPRGALHGHPRSVHPSPSKAAGIAIGSSAWAAPSQRRSWHSCCCSARCWRTHWTALIAVTPCPVTRCRCTRPATR